jgi:hypothetical protein
MPAKPPSYYRRISRLTNSPAQPSHTPVSATILGSSFLVFTLLGSTSQGNPSTISPSQGSGGTTSSQGRSTTPPNPPQGSSQLPTHSMAGTNPPPPPPMPYLASLNILDLSKLTNVLILNNATWTICLPNYLHIFQILKGNREKIPPTMS